MEPKLPILYSFRRCPYAMRARMAIVKSGQLVELREVKLRDKPQAMLCASPKGTVPVLVLDNGEVIDQSIDIMKWALDQSDPDNWLDETGKDLIVINDDSFKNHLDKYKYPDRYPESNQEHYRKQCQVFLQKLEDLLQNQDFLAGNEMKFVDVAIFPFVRQFAHVDYDWFHDSHYANIQKWLSVFIKSDMFEEAMVKHPQWHSDIQYRS